MSKSKKCERTESRWNKHESLEHVTIEESNIIASNLSTSDNQAESRNCLLLPQHDGEAYGVEVNLIPNTTSEQCHSENGTKDSRLPGKHLLGPKSTEEIIAAAKKSYPNFRSSKDIMILVQDVIQSKSHHHQQPLDSGDYNTNQHVDIAFKEEHLSNTSNQPSPSYITESEKNIVGSSERKSLPNEGYCTELDQCWNSENLKSTVSENDVGKNASTDATSLTEEKPKNTLSASEILELAEQALASSRRLVKESNIDNEDDLTDSKKTMVNKLSNPINDSCQSFTQRNVEAEQIKLLEEPVTISPQPSFKSFHDTDISELEFNSNINSPTRPMSPLSNPSVDDEDHAYSSLPVRRNVMQSSQCENRNNMLNILDGLPKKTTFSKRNLDNNDEELELEFSMDPNEENIFRGINLKEKTVEFLDPSEKIVVNESCSESLKSFNGDTANSTNTRIRSISSNLSHDATNTQSNQTVDANNPVQSSLEKWVKQVATFTTYDIEDVWKSEESNDDDCVCESMYIETTSSSFIFHEINRGNWSWCTAWSPDGNYLAVGTENHGLAVIDTVSTSVWKVIHDSRLKTNGSKKTSTSSIRYIAWGNEFIAIGGTSDSVSIIEPSGSFPIVHIIRGTGYVNQLSWRNNSSVLAIASRDDQCMLVGIKSYLNNADQLGGKGLNQVVMSQILLTINTADWVTAVSFSPDGSFLALSDRRGKLFIYYYVEEGDEVSMRLIKKIQFNGSILDVAWSAVGDKLFIGGEDYKCTVIGAPDWKILNKTKRDRWVQFVSPASSGTHVILGGGSPQCAMHCDVDNFKLMKLIKPFNGLILSAKWHPTDQFLSMTGQDTKLAIMETNVTRYVPNRCIRSVHSVVAMDISTCGKILIIGNSKGVITFFDISQSEIVILYEVVFAGDDIRTIRTSPDGNYVAIGGSNNMLMLVKIHKNTPRGQDTSKIMSRFSIQKIKRDVDNINSISFSPCSTMLTLSGLKAYVYRIATSEFQCIHELDIDSEPVLATEWSPDGSLLAMIGVNQDLRICYGPDEQWKIILKLERKFGGATLAWAPTVSSDLHYLAYGEENVVKILEIRTQEVTWENILEIPRFGIIVDLSWNDNGLLAVGFSNGCVVIVDLAYLQSGRAVNEMDYNWQRQGITCLTEIRNNKNNVSMASVQWISNENDTSNVLALGCNIGFEMIDLSPRHALSNNSNEQE